MSSTERGSQLFLLGRAPPNGAASHDVGAHMPAQEDVLQHRHVREQLDVLERPGDAELGDRSGRMPRMLSPPTGSRLLGRVDAVEAVEVEVLPAPLGPMIANSSPSST